MIYIDVHGLTDCIAVLLQPAATDNRLITASRNNRPVYGFTVKPSSHVTVARQPALRINIHCPTTVMGNSQNEKVRFDLTRVV